MAKGYNKRAIGKTKVLSILPVMKLVAAQNNLNLSKDFKKVKQIIEQQTDKN